MNRQKFRRHALPISAAACLTFGLAALFHQNNSLQAGTGSIATNTICPGSGTPACYYCNGNPSPGTVPAGCDNGDPPGWLFGPCGYQYDVNDCYQLTTGCGTNKYCASPYTPIGSCLSQNTICQN